MAKHIVIETNMDHQTPLGALFAERAVVEVLEGNRIGSSLAGHARLSEIDEAWFQTRAQTNADLKLRITSIMLEIEKGKEFHANQAICLLVSLADDLDYMEARRNESSRTAPASPKVGLHRGRSN